jgi:hypothetical protein
LILDRGGHGPGVIIKDNPGKLYEQNPADPKKAVE